MVVGNDARPTGRRIPSKGVRWKTDLYVRENAIVS